MAQEVTRLERDEASVHVLEAIVLSLILLGAAYHVATLQADSIENDRPRAHLETVARDAMIVLGGLEDGNGSLLDQYLLEAYHCAAAAVRASAAGGATDDAAGQCDGRRSANLTLRLESYLPPGTGHAFGLDNGVEARDIYRSTLPAGETVSATHTFTPQWNLTFLLPEMSCYEEGMEANLTAIPLRRGALATLTGFALEEPGRERIGESRPHQGRPFWNATLDTGMLPAGGLVAVDAEGRGGTFRGGAVLGACDMGGVGPTLVEVLRDGTLQVDPPVAPIGSRVTFSADVARLLELPGVTLVDANVTVYDPLPGLAGQDDTYLAAAVLAQSEGDPLKGRWTWDVPPGALYGVHPVVLKAALKLPTQAVVEVRLVDVLTVAMPDGTVPIDPPYRAVLQVWFSDWR